MGLAGSRCDGGPACGVGRSKSSVLDSRGTGLGLDTAWGQGSGWTRLGDCAAPVSADGAWGLVGQLDAVALGMAVRNASARTGPVNSAWRAPCGTLLHEQKVSRMRCGTQIWDLPSGSAQAVFDEPGRGLWLILDAGPRLCVVSLGEQAEVQVCAPDPASAG